jgi:hypothetical protein
MQICTKCKTDKELTEFHVDKSHRNGYSSQCKDCRNKYHKDNQPHYTALKKEWRHKNPERNNKTLRKYYYAHHEESLAKNKLRRVNNLLEIRGKEAKWKINSLYGVSWEEKQKMIDNQENLCKLCKKELLTTKDRCLDHNHITKKVRGILCRKCNTALGWLGLDNETTLAELIAYLTP